MQSAGPQVAGPAPAAVAAAPAVTPPVALAAAAAEQTLLQKNRVYMFWAQQKGFSHIVFAAFVYVPGCRADD